MAERFSIDEGALPAGVTLALAGELDISTAPRVEQAVRRACAGPCEELVLDLTELTFTDSTGVRALLGAVDICAAAYCALELIPSRHRAPGIAIGLLGLDRVLPWRARRPEAQAVEADDRPGG